MITFGEDFLFLKLRGLSDSGVGFTLDLGLDLVKLLTQDEGYDWDVPIERTEPIAFNGWYPRIIYDVDVQEGETLLVMESPELIKAVKAAQIHLARLDLRTQRQAGNADDRAQRLVIREALSAKQAELEGILGEYVRSVVAILNPGNSGQIPAVDPASLASL